MDIILLPFFDPELGNFLADITNRPVIISKLLNCELDPDVLELAQQNGLKVFPGQWNDLKMQCSSTDWAVPCKHLASVIYKVSAEIDNNPFLVFSLYSVDLFSELENLGIFINKQLEPGCGKPGYRPCIPHRTKKQCDGAPVHHQK